MPRSKEEISEILRIANNLMSCPNCASKKQVIVECSTPEEVAEAMRVIANPCDKCKIFIFNG